MLLFFVFNVLAIAVTVPEEMPLVVTSSSLCPNPKDIESQAASLGAYMTAELASIDVAVKDHAMHVRFIRKAAAAEKVAVERILPLPEACADRVSLASVAIASWLGQAHSELPTLPPPPPPEVPHAPAVAAFVHPTNASVPEASTAWQFGVGGMLTSADAWSVGMRTELARASRQKSFGWEVSATVGFPHRLAIGSGESRWTRATLLLGPRYETKVGALRLACDLAAGLTGIWAAGEGYARSQTDFALLPSGSVGTRLGWKRAPAWWLDTRFVISESSGLHAWSQETSQRAGLSRVDLQITLGASVDIF